MKWVWLIFLLLTVPLFAVEKKEADILSPGATGMKSNIDFDALIVTDAPFIKNLDPVSRPGLLIMRRAMKGIGDNSSAVYSATGYTNIPKDYKLVLATVNGPTKVYVGRKDPGADSTNYTLPPDTGLYKVALSNNHESGVQDSTLDYLMLSNGLVDFLKIEDKVIISDGREIPVVFTPEFGQRKFSSLLMDYAYYRPRLISLGMASPGQLDVGILNKKVSNGKYGLYRYWYSYNIGGIGTERTGLASRWVKADSQMVVLRNFEGYANNDSVGGYILDTIRIYRQEYGDAPYLIATIAAYPKEYVYFIDSVVDGDGSAGVYPYEYNDAIKSGYPIPGGLYRISYDTINPLDSVWHVAAVDSQYLFAYSYYDPLTGIESGLSPIMLDTLVKDTGGAANDTLLVGYRKGYTKIFERAPWIRIYRTTVAPTTDYNNIITNDFFGVCQVRANQCYPMDTTKGYEWTLFPGHGSDDDLENGMEFFLDSVVGAYSFDCVFRDDEADAPLIRPPYIMPLEIPFSDMEFANFRVWGVGDPVYPSRLYYSELNEYWNWSNLNYISLEEATNDELVTLAKIPGGAFDRLFAMKHNAIYEISGTDPEYDMTFSLVSDKVGAVNRRAVISAGGRIYFLSPDMRIYSLGSNGLNDISLPVENYIDTIFTNYRSAQEGALAYQLDDRIVWHDTSASMMLVYYYEDNVWVVYDYKSDHAPLGSFQHDTTEGFSGYGENQWWVYEAGTGAPGTDEKFMVEIAGSGVDSMDISLGTTNLYDVIYNTPYLGDGRKNWAVDEVNFTAKFSSYGTYIATVLNENGVTLDTDTLTVSAPDSIAGYRINFRPHRGRYVSFRLRGVLATQTAGSNLKFELHNLKVSIRESSIDALD